MAFFIPLVSDASSVSLQELRPDEDEEREREEPGSGRHDVAGREPEGAEQTPVAAARLAERVRREDVEEVGEVPRDGAARLARHAVVQLADAQVEEGHVEQDEFRLIWLAE